MKIIRWNLEKAEDLKKNRGIDLNRISILIEDGELLGVVDVPSRAQQSMFLLEYDNYLVCIPFVESDHEIFLKTAYRNRKLNKAHVQNKPKSRTIRSDKNPKNGASS